MRNYVVFNVLINNKQISKILVFVEFHKNKKLNVPIVDVLDVHLTLINY